MLESSHKATGNTNDQRYDQAYNEADLGVDKLTEDLAIAKNDDSNSTKHLESLQNIDEMSCLWTVESEKGITKAHHWVARGVKADESAPNEEARCACCETHEHEDADAKTVADR